MRHGGGKPKRKDGSPNHGDPKENEEPALHNAPLAGRRLERLTARPTRHARLELVDPFHLGVTARRALDEVARAAGAVGLAGSFDEATGVAARHALALMQPREISCPNRHDPRIAPPLREPSGFAPASQILRPGTWISCRADAAELRTAPKRALEGGSCPCKPAAGPSSARLPGSITPGGDQSPADVSMRIDQWIQHLEHLGGGRGVSASEPPAQPEVPAASLPPEPTLLSGGRGEQRLWRAAAGESTDVADILTVPVPAEGAPLLATDNYLAIEVWAECELSALHALHRLRRMGHPAVAERGQLRIDGAVRWHLVNTQPDNSTNRPWALHVFLEASTRPDTVGIDPAEAQLYAETLLGNMLATDARTERLSRWILADAAIELRAMTAPRHVGG